MSASVVRPPSPANRLGIDYRTPPPRKVGVTIVDAHTHLYGGEQLSAMLEAANLYGVGPILSMTPLAEVEAVRAACGDRVRFIAIPHWKSIARTDEFRAAWMRDLERFRELGARLCKFWMAPKMRKEHGLTVDHEFVRPVVHEAVRLGYEFMIHVADPSVWWSEGKPYADTHTYGEKAAQYPQLEWLLDTVAPRHVSGVHMAGSVEDLDRLDRLMERHANLLLDTSATKWMVREVSRHPRSVHDFVVRWGDRILFGSDLVASAGYREFDHYASRYWAHQRLWETDCDGESPIDDPDVDEPPTLRGCNLPPDTLEKIYSTNIRRLGWV